jgi:membrane protease YdiL (CAAX protease family)
MSNTIIAERPTATPPSRAPSMPSGSLAPPSPPRAFLQRHPVLTYFVLVVALSWGGVLLLTGGLGPMFGPDWRSDPRFMFGLLAGPAAVAVAGLALIGLTAGRAGYRELRARLLRWRVGARGCALALLLAPLSTLVVAVLLALSLGAPELLPAIFTAQDPVGLLLPGIVTGLWVGFCEELGWTGFAVPRLRRRHGVLATGLLVGVVWGALHFPLFRESGSFSAVLPLTLLLVKLFSWLPAYRVLMVWVYERTGSLLVQMLMHASLTATTMVLVSGDLSIVQSLTSLLVWAGALWVMALLLAGVRPQRLSSPAPGCLPWGRRRR